MAISHLSIDPVMRRLIDAAGAGRERFPVSVEATSSALNLGPVPADRGGQPSTAGKFVLVGLADHAGPDGTGAFPSVATLVRYTGLSERTAWTCLHRLAAEGIIAPCDPGTVAARIKRADRRQRAWDLSLVRDDLDSAALAVLDRQFPQLAVSLAAAGQPGAEAGLMGCHHRTRCHRQRGCGQVAQRGPAW